MSKLSDYQAALDRVAPGWNKDRWNAALTATKECRDSAMNLKKASERMESFINCRRGKRLPIGT